MHEVLCVNLNADLTIESKETAFVFFLVYTQHCNMLHLKCVCVADYREQGTQHQTCPLPHSIVNTVQCSDSAKQDV